MSTKFEQLLDLLVNEEMDKANELFHEIVVEKSREIYENLIAEEANEDDEEVDEGAEEDDDEEVDEGAEEDDDEEVDEGAEELEDSYMMDADDDDDSEDDAEIGGDATDKMLGNVEVGQDDEDNEGDEDSAIMDIKNAIQELEAAFAQLEKAQGGDMSSDMDSDMPMSSMDKADEMMGLREYRETVGNDWEKNSQKTQGQIVGANTGEKMPGSNEGKSPISSGKGKPTTGATAGNIVAKNATHNEDGTTPKGKVGGLVKSGGKFVGNNTLNVDNAQTGVKKLSKVSKPADSEGHAVGSGSGENSVKGATNTKSIVDHKIG